MLAGKSPGDGLRCHRWSVHARPIHLKSRRRSLLSLEDGAPTSCVCVGSMVVGSSLFQLAFILAAYYSWKQRISLLFSNYVQPFPETNESASHVCKVPYHRGFWLESGRPLPSKRTSNYQQLAEQLALLARLQNSGKSEPTINGAPTWWCFCKSPESLRNIHTCCRSDFKGR